MTRDFFVGCVGRVEHTSFSGINLAVSFPFLSGILLFGAVRHTFGFNVLERGISHRDPSISLFGTSKSGDLFNGHPVQ